MSGSTSALSRKACGECEVSRLMGNSLASAIVRSSVTRIPVDTCFLILNYSEYANI